MAENLAAKRKERLRKTPIFKVEPNGIDWYRDPGRSELANKMTWLGYNPSEESIRRAFDYYELDHTDPRQWRILMLYLCNIVFPKAGAPVGSRSKTKERNKSLLERSKEKQFAGLMPMETVKRLKTKFPLDYNGMTLDFMVKCLLGARRKSA